MGTTLTRLCHIFIARNTTTSLASRRNSQFLHKQSRRAMSQALRILVLAVIAIYSLQVARAGMMCFHASLPQNLHYSSSPPTTAIMINLTPFQRPSTSSDTRRTSLRAVQAAATRITLDAQIPSTVAAISSTNAPTSAATHKSQQPGVG